MTALHRLDMLLISLCKYSMDSDAHPRLRTSNSSSSFFGLRSVVIQLAWPINFLWGLSPEIAQAISLHSRSYLRDIAELLHLCVLDRYHAEIQNYYHTFDEQKE